MDYHYPIDETWSKEEVVDVINFFQQIEKAYEKGAKREDILLTYKRFKEIVPSKSEEKQICGQFEKGSGYSCYHTVKTARGLEAGDKVEMKVS
ncbi:uncharacterized protein YktA (UPF0223 family) [Salirhabdus euzebyi]|uniref:UPF0223 protein HNQ94_003467 n=1 Tax=Salirhabdus euzebyi TaxID=394506 RepID=A0A841Q9J1_9BACI|nr:UPF0223 family protein [Salirhabdus euzebyi]MBB6454973.1 uncharacterized protein YktA (UPF0223 family) [Salirhabdus euzebyi]